MDILGQSSYLNIVFFACIILSVLCSVQGVFVYMSKNALAGDSAAHACIPGAIIGSIVAQNEYGLASSFTQFIASIICAFIALWLINSLSDKELDKGTATASVTGGFLGLGLSLFSYIPQTNSNIKLSAISVMFGQPTSIDYSDAKLILYITILISLITLVLYKEIKLFLFDKEQALLIGIKTKYIKYLLLFCQIMTIALAIRMVGALMAIALISVPATCARINASSIKQMIVYSLLFAITSTITGLSLSLNYDISGGATIIICNTLWLIPCCLFNYVKSYRHG